MLKKSPVTTRLILGLLALIVLASAAWYLSTSSLGIKESAREEAKEIVLYNWNEYTDLSVLEDFEKEFGIRVILKEYEIADTMLSEIQSDPSKYDIIIMGGGAILDLSKAKLLGELDLDKIPNFKFIKEDFKAPPYDPQNKYSVPYLWGTTGLVINTNFISEDADSWAILWDEKNKGKIALIDDVRDSMTAVLKYSNLSVNEKDPDKLKIAEKNALLLKSNKVHFSDSLENLENVMNGDMWAAQVYNGDVILRASDRKDIQYFLPKEGAVRWVDNYVISAGSEKKEEVHMFINFLLRLDISARSGNKFLFASPNKDVEALINSEILSNPVIYPSEDQLQNSEYILNVGEAQSEYNRIYSLMK